MLSCRTLPLHGGDNSFSSLPPMRQHHCVLLPLARPCRLGRPPQHHCHLVPVFQAGERKRMLDVLDRYREPVCLP